MLVAGNGVGQQQGEQRGVVVVVAVARQGLEDPVAELLGRPDRRAGGRQPQLLHPLLDRALPILDQPVGVEQEQAAGLEHQALLAVGRAPHAEGETRVELQEAGLAVGLHDERREVAGAGEPERAAPGLQPTHHAGGEVQVGDRLHDPVDPLEDGGRPVSLEGVRPDRRTQLAHHGGGLHPPAHDVADDEDERPVPGLHQVEPVAADLGTARTGQVAARAAQQRAGRHLVGQQAPLQRLGHLALEGVPAGVVEGQRGPPDQVEDVGHVGRGVGLFAEHGEGREGATPRGQRHDETAVRPHPAQTREPLLVTARQRDQDVVRDLREELVDPGREHRTGTERRVEGDREALHELPDVGLAVGVVVLEGPQRHLPVLAEHMQDRPVGQSRHHHAGQCLDQGVRVEAPGEDRARLRQQAVRAGGSLGVAARGPLALERVEALHGQARQLPQLPLRVTRGGGGVLDDPVGLVHGLDGGQRDGSIGEQAQLARVDVPRAQRGGHEAGLPVPRRFYSRFPPRVPAGGGAALRGRARPPGRGRPGRLPRWQGRGHEVRRGRRRAPRGRRAARPRR